MKRLKDIELPTDYKVIRTNKKIEYINLSVGFDIETTSSYIDDEKVAYMYIYTLGITDNKHIWHGRTWEELQQDLFILQDHFNLNEKRRLIIYVHNLGYEFQFMRKYFEWVDVFSVSERKPIKALTTLGIEFRDSYILSGYSLQNLAKNLTTYKVEKLVGDLDYKLKRNQKTPITDRELQYCINDVDIILAYIKEQMDTYLDITKVPLTNTGRVRKYVKHNCYFTNKSHKKSDRNKFFRYRKIMNDLQLDLPQYEMLKRCFMGGFTHANANYVNQTLSDVTSIDFTSSYPAVMLTEKYPMSKGIKVDVKDINELYDLMNRYCCMFDVKFTNLIANYHNENYLSKSKCRGLKNSIINNGRVVKADELYTTITDVDFEIITKCYEWDSISVRNVYKYYKGYLPKPIIESILDLYKDKTVLKGIEGKEVEYLLSKGMLNSVYGMTVTDLVRPEISYKNEWNVNRLTEEEKQEQINNYNNSKTRFLYYPWGVWVTAYARRNLWTGIIAVKDDYIYSDTDSIKMKNYNQHIKYIDWYNELVTKKLQQMSEYYNIDFNRFKPKTKDGKEKLIGVWDYDGHYKRFKTLGAKRYLIQDDSDNYIMTVAGLSKQQGMKYLKEEAEAKGVDVFDLFNNKMFIPPTNTGKQTHTYIDLEYTFDDIDYLGNQATINTKSGVHLEEVEFTLNQSELYISFLENLKKGYIYKGVSKYGVI